MRGWVIAAVCGACLSLWGGADVLRAGDWPQILGPDRNGIAQDEQLADSWPEGGPETVWQRKVGRGFAGVSVKDGTAVLFHRVGDEEVVEAMEAGSGKVLWKKAFPTSYRPTVVPDDGPRAVPIVHDGRVYVYGADGGLRCLDLKSGRVVWSRNVLKEFDAAEGYFGAGSSPIIEGDKLLLNVGSRDGAGIVAFSLKTGETVWKATDERASYSSPVAATVDGVRHVIFVTRLNVVSIDPQTGEVRFRFPFGKRGPTVNGANPLVLGRHLFVSSSYGVGARWARIEDSGAEVLWNSDQVMSSQYTTCIEHEGYLYGVDGRQDVPPANFRCFDPKTQEIQWTKNGYGYATLIKADGKLILVETDGELVLAEPSPEEYRELERVRVFSSTVRALPALSEGLLYVYDEETLKCLDVGEK